MIKNNLTAEWKNSQKITIEIDNPITEEIDRYHVTLRAEMIDKMLYIEHFLIVVRGLKKWKCLKTSITVIAIASKSQEVEV